MWISLPFSSWFFEPALGTACPFWPIPTSLSSDPPLPATCTLWDMEVCVSKGPLMFSQVHLCRKEVNPEMNSPWTESSTLKMRGTLPFTSNTRTLPSSCSHHPTVLQGVRYDTTRSITSPRSTHMLPSKPWSDPPSLHLESGSLLIVVVVLLLSV